MHPVEKRRLNLGRHSLGPLVLEMVMIVFSILLALTLESWKEGRHDRRLAGEALGNIRTELAQNRAEIETALPRHEKLLADLQVSIDRQGKPIPGAELPSLGLRPPRLFKTAWETAGATQALVRSDYKLVLAVAKAYDSQRWMSLVEEKWLQAILNPAAFDSANRVRFFSIFHSVASEYLALEKRLLPELDRAMALLSGN
jgi:hypothetical protein